ncbi:MAG: hypothetical protein ACI8Q1_000232 [Parvicella sp.]|jgi:hypothetical protein
MKIETKFNVGDNCYYLECDKVMNDKITGMKIKIRAETINVVCVVSKRLDRDESLVHKTKEDLLASL